MAKNNLRKLIGKWTNDNCLLTVEIEENTATALVIKYCPPLIIENNSIEQEIIEVMILSLKDKLFKITNCNGSWTLKLHSDKKAIISNLPISNSKQLIFEFLKLD